jgi:DNA-binding transcriptional regulator PaaX
MQDNLARNILKGILIAGEIAIASTSPYFVKKAIPRIIKYAAYKIKQKKRLESFCRSFYYLNKKGFINIENKNGQIFISLTAEGKRRAGEYNLDNLSIQKPQKWDGYWRILIFDIKNKQKVKREALRGKIKELGLFQLQKSVWIYPYDFKKELDFLRSFFYLNKKEMQIIMAKEIENDQEAKVFFKLD